MTAHVRRICRTSFYQLRQLRTVRRSLSSEACTTLVHAFVTSRLDYCNSLLAGISDSLLLQLQSVLRVAARLVMRKGKFDPISDDIRDHCIGFQSRREFNSNLVSWCTSVSVVVHHPTLPRCLCRTQMCLLFVHSVQLPVAVLLSHGQKLLLSDLVALLPQAQHLGTLYQHTLGMTRLVCLVLNLL